MPTSPFPLVLRPCDVVGGGGGGGFFPDPSFPQRFRSTEKMLQGCHQRRGETVPACVQSGGRTLSHCPFSSQEEFEKALVWYESTLKLQPEFVPAKNRIQTIQCHLMLKKGRRSP